MKVVGYFGRSANYIKEQLGSLLNPLIPKPDSIKVLFKFDSEEAVKRLIIGSDMDIGGESTCFLASTGEGAKFYGNISTAISGELQRSGYAGMRTKEPPVTLFHHPRMDVSLYRYIEIRAKGDKRLWMVNLQTDSLYPTVIWQHRMHFMTPGQWETIRVSSILF